MAVLASKTIGLSWRYFDANENLITTPLNANPAVSYSLKACTKIHKWTEMNWTAISQSVRFILFVLYVTLDEGRRQLRSANSMTCPRTTSSNYEENRETVEQPSSSSETDQRWLWSVQAAATDIFVRTLKSRRIATKCCTYLRLSNYLTYLLTALIVTCICKGVYEAV